MSTWDFVYNTEYSLYEESKRRRKKSVMAAAEIGLEYLNLTKFVTWVNNFEIKDGMGVVYWFSINRTCMLKTAAIKIRLTKENETIADKKNVWLNINHRCNGNWGFEMRFN